MCNKSALKREKQFHSTKDEVLTSNAYSVSQNEQDNHENVTIITYAQAIIRELNGVIIKDYVGMFVITEEPQVLIIHPLITSTPYHRWFWEEVPFQPRSRFKNGSE